MSRKVSDWVEGYLAYTDNTEPCVLYRRWVAISVLAAVLQRKCRLELGMEVFYPNFYIVLVGPPAARKGTAIGPGRSFLDRLGIPLAADESSRQKLINALMEAAVADPTEGGLTYHASLTIISSELTVFLGYQNIELLGYLCDWFDCRNRFVYETHSRGREEVANVWVNLLGATTPSLLQSSLPEGAVGSGFTSRTIFVFAKDKGKTVYVPSLSLEQKALEADLLQDLDHIRSLSGQFFLEEKALALYITWRRESEETPPFREPRLDYYTQRRQVHLLKLSLLYSASRGDSKRISEDDMAKAIWTLEETEVLMPRVFEGIGRNPVASAQTRLMRLVAERKSLPMNEISEAFYHEVSTRELGEIIASLEAMGWCRMDIKTRKLVYTRKD